MPLRLTPPAPRQPHALFLPAVLPTGCGTPRRIRPGPQGTPELRHSGYMFIGLWIAEDSVLIAVKFNRATVLQQIALQGFEVTERAH